MARYCGQLGHKCTFARLPAILMHASLLSDGMPHKHEAVLEGADAHLMRGFSIHESLSASGCFRWNDHIHLDRQLGGIALGKLQQGRRHARIPQICWRHAKPKPLLHVSASRAIQKLQTARQGRQHADTIRDLIDAAGGRVRCELCWAECWQAQGHLMQLQP